MSLRNPLRFDDQHPFTGRHMLALVLAFFVTVIAVNLAMALIATGTFPGLVVSNSYVASQNYNRALAETRALDRSGWDMELAAPGGILTLRLTGRDGLAVAGLKVRAMAGRPSTTGEDRRIALVGEAGLYRAADPLSAGLWDVAVEAYRDGDRVFARRQRIHVRGGEAG